MKLSDIMDINILKANGIIPVVCLKSEEELKTFSKAICDTPISCVEITFRHPFAPVAVKRLKENFPHITVGAGTILTESLLDEAKSANADFCVSPGTSFSLIKASEALGMPFLPGCSTPSEIQLAAEYGLDTVKFFPAEISGGTSALKLYNGAFSGISFVPTGGITMENLSSYLSLSNVLACGGSFMSPSGLVEEGNNTAIYELICRCTEIRRKDGQV